MAYTRVNYKTKKALKEAMQSGITVKLQHKYVGENTWDGTEWLEGPHYPEAHTWWAQVQVKNGSVISIK